ncbi:PREDICTED: pentatricopeptide repeat-containing protein At3g60960, mitochondrial-like [Camelina sativa]|uniref:Pentatricopeptide repeat-containing protein At3g60960, mitochondrial-like n=1 Tax=Camelina sativa TaxID=90675 RepID=A0ABM0YY31_CAMSA|nr:PREDICTED: pentatricopeptide repeat-containing protein At3g60960, mitochondrial-like [Camelina sativa]
MTSLGRNLWKNFACLNRYFSSASAAAVRYSVGRDPSSLPLALTQKLPKNPIPCFVADRPVSLRYRVKTMIELSQLDKAAEIARFAGSEDHRDGPETTIVMCNEIIDAMIGAKRYVDAKALFHYFFNECKINPSVVSFNHMIKVHCIENRLDKALQLYRHARVSRRDNEDTYRILTKALVHAGRIYEALGMIKAVGKYDLVAYTYLIRGFLDLGNIHKAGQLAKCMEYQSYYYIGIRNAEFMEYWFRQGNDEKAMNIYSSIMSSNEIYLMGGDTLLRILLKYGKISEAWALFKKMINNPVVRPNFSSETINMMVNECFKIGNFKEAMDTFKVGASFSSCYTNIIDRFCELGMMTEAEGLFEGMWSHKDDLVLSLEIPTFRSMINGYVKAGRVDDAQQMLKKMVNVSLLKVAVRQAD